MTEVTYRFDGANRAESILSSLQGEPSNLLDWLYRDVSAIEIFSISATYKTWIEVEIALAHGHYEKGIISAEDLEVIKTLTNAVLPDFALFRNSAINVGYPIMELLTHLNQQIPSQNQGKLHLGATTQDILDSALALQTLRAGNLLMSYVTRLGNALKDLVEKNELTLMAGRTHAQQAVPTTFGLKCAIYLSEISRHRERLSRAFHEASRISLFGAAGTSAAMGLYENEVRAIMAKNLGLQEENVPWHVSRDRLIEVTSQCASLCVTIIRFAREIIDLSRNEINEVYEPGGLHKGASSTMPQKRNPVMSEAIVGVGIQAIGNAKMMFRAGEVGHERAAGEWQLEWKSFPETIISTITATKISFDLVEGLGINQEAMSKNLKIHNGSIMAEAYMIELAPYLGREKAHNLIREATQLSQRSSIEIFQALEQLQPEVIGYLSDFPLQARDYIGNAQLVCKTAIQTWETLSTN